MDFEPIVLGGDTLGYSYARELHRCYSSKTTMLAGADIKYSSASRFTDYHTIEDIDKEQRLMEWLHAHAGHFDAQPVVIAGASDWHVRNLSKHKQELEELGYVIPYIDFDLLDDITQKDRFYARCDRLGMPYPKTIVVPFSDSYDDSVLAGTSMRVVREKRELSGLSYPLIAKPSNSADWHYADISGKNKVYIVSSEQELFSIYDAVAASSYSHALLIQERLSASDESLHTLTTFSDANGTAIVAVSGDVLVQDRSATGIGNPLVIMSTGKHHDLLEAAGRFLADTGYEGYANFDVMDDADGNPHFLEVNTRPGRNTYYVSLAGCPFVKPLIEHFVMHHDLHDALSAKELAADDDFLFTMVPRSVIDHETHGAKHDDAMRMFDSGHWSSPLLCREDTLRQRFWGRVNFEHMRLKF